MTIDEELQFLKKQVQDNLERSRKRTLRTSIFLVILVLFSMISWTYGYIQKIAAMKAKDEAVANAMEALRQRMIAAENEAKAKRAEEALASATEALKKCEEVSARKSK